jgi:hypothetical protein
VDLVGVVHKHGQGFQHYNTKAIEASLYMNHILLLK